MVDKKTATIAVLVIIALLGWGFWFGLSIIAGAEKGLLEVENEALKNNYDLLNNSYCELSKRYDEQSENYDNLSEDYSILVTDYYSLNWTYGSLKENYVELNSTIEEGEAIAKSAEWVSEDERLKVTSELITSGTWWITYTVRVTITNIGDEPIDKVVIFVFPYEDGKFAETYWEYHEHTVENIYIGETYGHDFTSLPEEMTSYKVLAVAG